VLDKFSTLPVFCLRGGTEVLRAECLAGLRAELAKSSLRLAVLQRQDGCTPYAAALLAQRFDLVVVDGAADFPGQRIWIGEADGDADRDLVWGSGRDEDQAGFMGRLFAKLNESVRRTPVWGCVLIGGRSSRMGRPKHLLVGRGGKTWLENTLAILHPLLDGIVVSGGGPLPEAVADTVRLPDIPGVAGPLTGILAAGRWQPLVSWLLVACDMPNVSTEAVTWVLAGRRAGCWGRVPRLAGQDHPEPLLAWYDFRAIQLFEAQVYTGSMRIGEAVRHHRIDHPVIPESLRLAWENINTPGELRTAEEAGSAAPAGEEKSLSI
jgi:molybdopterin-guanine dinucleotide biosynthesis protein A